MYSNLFGKKKKDENKKFGKLPPRDSSKLNMGGKSIEQLRDMYGERLSELNRMTAMGEYDKDKRIKLQTEMSALDGRIKLMHKS